jgi:N-acetylneuraminic acid mutarotase
MQVYRYSFALPILVGALLAGCRDETPTDLPGDPDLGKVPASATATGSWAARVAYPDPIWKATSVAITDPVTRRTNLYVIGGSRKEFAFPGNITDAVKAYDVSTRTWRSRAPYPVRITNPNEAVELNGKIYVSGGSSRVWDEEHDVYRADHVLLHHVYNPATNKWTRKRDIPTPSDNGVSAAYQGRIYVATRCENPTLCGDLPGGAIWRYNPSTDRWVLLTRTPGDYRVGGVIAGKFYLVTDLGVMDIYDVASNTWTTGPQRPKRLCVQASATLQAKLYLVGLCHESDGSIVYPTLVFDPNVGAWSQAAAAPANTREYHTLARVSVNGVPGLDLIGGPESGNHWRFVP